MIEGLWKLGMFGGLGPPGPVPNAESPVLDALGVQLPKYDAMKVQKALRPNTSTPGKPSSPKYKATVTQCSPI